MTLSLDVATTVVLPAKGIGVDDAHVPPVYRFFRGNISGAPRLAGMGGGQAAGTGRLNEDISYMSERERAT